MDKKNANLGNWFIDQLNVYQSANSDSQSIKQNFIIRREEFELIINSMKVKKANDPIQHELILGRRGSGKSTLLKRIEIEICENEKLNKRFICINLAEEQAGVYRLFDLWEYVLDELRHKLTEQITLPDYSTFDDDQEYTHSLYTLIHGICKKHKKKIILLLDNFDRIVENFTDDGNLLRETLINYSDVQIIAGSTRMDEHFWKYDKPFYEFFRRHRLEALSRDEMQLLLLHWSDSLGISELRKFVLESPGKLENIRILTDGLPRTLQFFIQIVLQKTENTSYQYLKKVMDNVSPVYQERLNHLTPQLRKTVLEMAFIWEACGTKQLVSKTKMQSKLISANLKTLADKGIVDIIGTAKKQNLYRLSERFFNMWLIITQGNPAQKRKAKWLSIFLENWYDAADFKNLTEEHIKNLKSGKTDWDKALVHSKALSQSRYISLDDRDSIIRLTEELRQVSFEDSLLELPRKFEEVNIRIIEAFKSGNYDRAIELLNELENEEDGFKFYGLGLAYKELSDFSAVEKYYLKSIEKKNTYAMYNLALMYSNRNEFKLAEKYYLMAIEYEFSDAMYNLALIYEDRAELELAEKYYLMAIQDEHTHAMYNLALIYHNRGQIELAEEYYLLAIKREHSGAMYNLALIYDNREELELAEKYYLLAIEKEHSSSMYNLGLLYNKREDYKLAEKYYLMAGEKGNFAGMFSLALIYDNLEELELAEKYYLIAIEENNSSAMHNLGLLYHTKGEFKLAEKYYLMAVKEDNVESMYNLGNLYNEMEKFELAGNSFKKAIENGHLDAMFNLAQMYQEQGNMGLAETYYLMAIENEDSHAMCNLAWIYYYTDRSKIQALELIKKRNQIELDTVREGLQVLIEIWNGIFNNTEERVLEILVDSVEKDMEELLIELLNQKQKSLILKLFNNSEIGEMLKEKYLVVYYVAQLLSNKEEDNLELKIPPELVSTVDEVLASVKERQAFYGYS